MMTLKNMTKKMETDKPKYGCEFCKRGFLRESTVLKHICEYKQRWLTRDLQGNRLGFQAWLQFYQKNSTSKKKRTYEEFIKSAYYTAFVKFGAYCIDVHAINPSIFVDWLLKNQIKIDVWNTDTIYTRYLIEYLREEDPFDAIARSVETTIKLAEVESIRSSDIIRFGNPNKICYAVTTGKISPWMLYQSNSGTQFLETLNPDHVKIIIDYINPELWALKFKRNPESVEQVKELLRAGGY